MKYIINLLLILLFALLLAGCANGEDKVAVLNDLSQVRSIGLLRPDNGITNADLYTGLYQNVKEDNKWGDVLKTSYKINPPKGVKEGKNYRTIIVALSNNEILSLKYLLDEKRLYNPQKNYYYALSDQSIKFINKQINNNYAEMDCIVYDNVPFLRLRGVQSKDPNQMVKAGSLNGVSFYYKNGSKLKSMEFLYVLLEKKGNNEGEYTYSLNQNVWGLSGKRWQLK